MEDETNLVIYVWDVYTREEATWKVSLEPMQETENGELTYYDDSGKFSMTYFSSDNSVYIESNVGEFDGTYYY